MCVGGLSVHVPCGADFTNQEGTGLALLEEDIRDCALNIPSGGTRSRRTKLSRYKRAFYLRERISQWFMSEPEIPDEDWELMSERYIIFLRSSGFKDCLPRRGDLAKARGKCISGFHEPTREQIRSILHDCDSVRDDEAEYSFVTRYLEKWLTIRWRFCGKGTRAKELPGNLLEFLLNAFERLDHAFPHVRETIRRKSFPNYNEVWRNLLTLYRSKRFQKDFPPLRTRRAFKKFEISWWFLCKYLKWPYLTKDAQILRRYLRTANKLK